MADTIVTVDRLQVRRSSTPGYRPGDNGSRPLADGEEFVNFADGVRLIGDGLTPAADLKAYPLLTAQDLDDLIARLTLLSSARFSADDGNLSDGQTALTILGGYTPGIVMVFRNGVVLQTKDYTATDGSRVILKTAARADDVIDVRGFKVGGVANAAPAQHQHNVADVLGLGLALENKLDREVLVKATAPAASDIPAGTFRVMKNTATGRFSIFVNDGGTIIDLMNGKEF